MDFIKGLPKSQVHSCIPVVVDRLGKFGFIALKHPITTKSVTITFIKEVESLYGFPSSIVTDQEKVFLSRFGVNYFEYSSYYHP